MALVDLNYNWFTSLPLDQRIDWVDSLELNNIVQTYTRSSLKSFFRLIFESESNSYLQKKAVEVICELTFINAIRHEFTKDFLIEDITFDKDIFIVITKLKYLFLLFGDDPDVYSELDIASTNPNAEIASEACYRKGLIHLLYRTSYTNQSSFLIEIEKALQQFELTHSKEENRIDASFFILTTQSLIELFNSQLEAFQQTFFKLSALLWQRQIWGWQQTTDLYEWHIYKALSNLQSIAKHTTSEAKWINYKREFSILSKKINDLVAVDILSKQLIDTYSAFNKNVSNVLLDRYYTQNLSGCQAKISSLLAELDDSEEQLTAFLTSLKDNIQASQEKKNLIPNEKITKLYYAFPNIGTAIITHDFQALIATGITPETAFVTLISKYLSEIKGSLTDYNTGYPQGDLVLKDLSGKISQLLPSYPWHQKTIFLGILSDIIRYAYQSLVQAKDFFLPLYDSKTKDEDTFHKHLYNKLTAGDRAIYYKYEDTTAIAGGRIDIVYRSDDIVLPIEVKKVSIKPTWMSIKEDFVTQAQTYIHPYNQLGILVIFDLSPKTDGGPLNNFYDLFEILHLTPYYQIPNTCVDYVIAVIIPGNKIRPSAYTRYSD